MSEISKSPIIQGPALDCCESSNNNSTILGPALPSEYHSTVEGPPEFPPYVILRDPGRSLFVKLEGQYALYGHLDDPGHLPSVWRPIPTNPVGEWSTKPVTGLLVFTHRRGTFEEQKGKEFWREIQNGETYYVYERLE